MAEQTPKAIFEKDFPAKLAAKPTLPKEINASYEFNITGPTGGVWTVDLTEAGNGKITEGTTGAAGCTVTMTDAVFVDIMNKKTNTQMAFMSGKLKVSNVNLALKLTKVL
jgi:putative sterol carrier protein